MDDRMRPIDKDLISLCGQLLIQKELKIAFAESATAGRLAAEFALVQDAGKFLMGGLVCYDASLKTAILGVDEQLIRSHTPESEIVTRGITKGLKQLIPADIYIGCTGLTCPGGSEDELKPVGTMFLYGMRGEEVLFSDRTVFEGGQEEIILSAVERVAQLLVDWLQK